MRSQTLLDSPASIRQILRSYRSLFGPTRAGIPSNCKQRHYQTGTDCSGRYFLVSVSLCLLWEGWCGGQTALNVFVFLASCIKRQFDWETMIKSWFNYLSFSWLHSAKRLSASSSSSSSSLSFFLSAAQWNHGSASKDVQQSVVVLLFWQWWCLCTWRLILLRDDWFVKFETHCERLTLV